VRPSGALPRTFALYSHPLPKARRLTLSRGPRALEFGPPQQPVAPDCEEPHAHWQSIASGLRRFRDQALSSDRFRLVRRSRVSRCVRRNSALGGLSRVWPDRINSPLHGRANWSGQGPAAGRIPASTEAGNTVVLFRDADHGRPPFIVAVDNRGCGTPRQLRTCCPVASSSWPCWWPPPISRVDRGSAIAGSHAVKAKPVACPRGAFQGACDTGKPRPFYRKRLAIPAECVRCRCRALLAAHLPHRGRCRRALGALGEAQQGLHECPPPSPRRDTRTADEGAEFASRRLSPERSAACSATWPYLARGRSRAPPAPAPEQLARKRLGSSVGQRAAAGKPTGLPPLALAATTAQGGKEATEGICSKKPGRSIPSRSWRASKNQARRCHPPGSRTPPPTAQRAAAAAASATQAGLPGPEGRAEMFQPRHGQGPLAGSTEPGQRGSAIGPAAVPSTPSVPPTVFANITCRISHHHPRDARPRQAAGLRQPAAV